jgi:hypothetical protein
VPPDRMEPPLAECEDEKWWLATAGHPEYRHEHQALETLNSSKGARRVGVDRLRPRPPMTRLLVVPAFVPGNSFVGFFER